VPRRGPAKRGTLSPLSARLGQRSPTRRDGYPVSQVMAPSRSAIESENGFRLPRGAARRKARSPRSGAQGGPRESRLRVRGGDGLRDDGLVRAAPDLSGRIPHRSEPAASVRGARVAEELLLALPGRHLLRMRRGSDGRDARHAMVPRRLEEDGQEARHGKVVHPLQARRGSRARRDRRGDPPRAGAHLHRALREGLRAERAAKKRPAKTKSRTAKPRARR
jgi:hypothetical protein